MTELKPCPFCGCSDPYYVTDGGYILCPNCLIELHTQVGCGEKQLCKDWNRRVKG